MYKNLYNLPNYLLDTKLRRYILKNQIHSNYKIPEYLIKGVMQKGKKLKAENLFFSIVKHLKYIKNFFILMNIAIESLSNPVELSPARFGKKIKMIPRISTSFRQMKRGIFVLTLQARSRKYISKKILPKLVKEFISSVYFTQDSFRITQD